MTKLEAAKAMGDRRLDTGLTQREMALATGISQAQVSAFERGEGSTSPTAVAYLDLITKTPIDDLRALAAAAVKNLRDEKKREAAVKAVAKTLPAIAREIRQFRARHKMTLDDVADTIGFSESHTYRIVRGEAVPDDAKIAEIRASMAKYEGKPVKVERPVTDKPGAVPPVQKKSPFTGGSNNAADGKPVTPAPKATSVVPTFESVNAEGVFLVNGTNLAPHLTLDGKTMHVFTVVPGGVFLSKLTMKGT